MLRMLYITQAGDLHFARLEFVYNHGNMTGLLAGNLQLSGTPFSQNKFTPTHFVL